MQFESLMVFCDVARQRSFSLAAQANDLSQSAVSQIVQDLEKRLGVQLVDRSTRPLQLTPLGQRYYDGCKAMIEQYQELEAALRDAQAQIAAHVRVAAIYSVGLGDMSDHVERFAAGHPNAHVHVEYLHPDRVYEEVLQGVADFGLVSFPRKLRELAVLPWREEEMVLACSPRHRLGKFPSLRPAQLLGEKFIGFDRALQIRREVDRFLREQDVSVDVIMEFDNIENIKKAVEISAGVALLPEPTIRREVQAGALVALPVQGCRLVRPLGMIYRRHHKLSTTARAFLDLLRESAGPSPPAGGDAGRRRDRNGSARASR